MSRLRPTNDSDIKQIKPPAPDVVRLGIFGDPHFAIQPPVSRKLYLKEFEAIIDSLMDIGEATRPQRWLCPGDWFHSKRAGNAETQRLIRIISPVVEKWGPILTIPGNHDLIANNTNSLDRQSIGVLFEAGILQNVARKPVRINRGVSSVGVTGIGKPLMTEADQIASMIVDAHDTEWGDENEGMIESYVVLTHFEYTPDSRLPNWFPKFKVMPCSFLLVNGHMHEIQGATQYENGVTFLSTGSLMRVSRSEEKMKARAYIASFYRSKFSVQSFELGQYPSGHVFTPITSDDELEETPDLSDFIERLKECGDIVTDDPMRALRELAKESKVSESAFATACDLLRAQQ